MTSGCCTEEVLVIMEKGSSAESSVMPHVKVTFSEMEQPTVLHFTLMTMTFSIPFIDNFDRSQFQCQTALRAGIQRQCSLMHIYTRTM